MNHQALKNIISVCPLAGVIAVILLCFSQVFAIPPRPEAIEFQPLEYTPPRAADFRRMLSDGTIVYVAESHEFPLVNVSITFKGGGSLFPILDIGLITCVILLRARSPFAADGFGDQCTNFPKKSQTF